MNFSKPIQKADDASKALIIEALAGKNTYGFDIDSIYYFEREDQWIVIEFLKCDHAKVRPSQSHPKRYWNKNWRKFASLWRLVKELDAEHYLVNYEDLEHAKLQGRSKREFHIIEVLSLDPTEAGGITNQNQQTLDFTGFKTWFQTLNDRGGPKRK